MLGRIASWFKGGALESPKAARRAFDAAAYNRLTAGWLAASNTLDQDLRAGLDTMRARAREMCQNNEYAVRFLAMVRANVVGPSGIKLICKVRDPNGQSDTLANQAIEAAWAEWGAYGVCEIGGRHSLVSAMHAAANTLAQDGEILIRVWRGAMARNPHNIAFQLLDPARIDTRVNRERGATLPAIRMGVEIDEFGRPLAYWLRDPGNSAATAERVPADDIIHRFLPLWPEQSRGVPWMHSAIRRLHDLGGYREAAIIAARIGASKMGFFSPSADADPEHLPDGYQANGTPYMSAEPGEFGVLPAGVNFEAFDPAYPHDQFDAFIKAALRGIAAGLGVSYHGLSNDLTDVNFSSIRSGTLEERDQWRVIQGWFAAAVVDELYRRWLPQALLSGAIVTTKGAPLPAAKLDKFKPHAWQPRTWDWVDPLKDVAATREKIDAGLSTLTHEAAKLGTDLEDVLATRAAEAALFAKYGISPPGIGATQDPAQE